MKFQHRKLRQLYDDSAPSTTLPPTSHPNRTAPFDSSVTLTVIVLLIALFFISFFSMYIRPYAQTSAADISHYDHRPRFPRSPFSSSPSARHHQDGSVVRSLAIFSYYGDSKRQIDCPVCLREFEEGERVKMIPFCNHVFHPTCIDTWLSTKASCPVCRCNIRVAKKSSLENGGTSRLGVRRASSCSSIGERMTIHRTLSF